MPGGRSVLATCTGDDASRDRRRLSGGARRPADTAPVLRGGIVVTGLIMTVLFFARG